MASQQTDETGNRRLSDLPASRVDRRLGLYHSSALVSTPLQLCRLIYSGFYCNWVRKSIDMMNYNYWIIVF